MKNTFEINKIKNNQKKSWNKPVLRKLSFKDTFTGPNTMSTDGTQTAGNPLS